MQIANADEYIDVKGLADGLYLLQTVADPDNLLVESSESNNCGGVYIRLHGLDSASPSATLQGPTTNCAP